MSSDPGRNPSGCEKKSFVFGGGAVFFECFVVDIAVVPCRCFSLHWHNSWALGRCIIGQHFSLMDITVLGIV